MLFSVLVAQRWLKKWTIASLIPGLIHNSYLPLCRSREQEESSLTVFSPLFLKENEGDLPSSDVSTFGLDYLANFYFGKSRLAETETRKEGEYVIKKETPWQILKSLRFER